MLPQLFESLNARQSRPLNCAVVGTNLVLADLIGCPPERINQIDISLPCWDEICESEALGIYPTGWADLIIVNLAVFAEIQRCCLWREMVRIAAGQGVMVALLPEVQELSLVHFDLAIVQGVLAPYVQSYGTEPWTDGKNSVHWALRNTRVFSPETLKVNGQDLSARGSNDRMDQVANPQQSVPHIVVPMLVPEAQDGQASKPVSSTQPMVIHVLVNDSGTLVGSLQKHLGERTEACRLAEVTIDDLQHRHTALRAEMGARAESSENQDVSIDKTSSPCDLSLASDSSVMRSAVTTLSLEADPGQLEVEASTAKPLPLKAYVRELEASIGRLGQQLEEKNEVCRQADADFQGLRHRYTKLWAALVMGNCPESQDISVDEPFLQIADLWLQLSEMTESYLEMRETVFALTSSRFWRITWLPRRLLDRLKAYLRPPILLEATKDSGFESASPPAVISPTGTDISSDQPSAVHCDYPDWQQLWTGNFLKPHAVVTSSNQPRLDRILFVDWRLPEPDQDSGSCRIIAILEMAVSLGLRVDFISDAEHQQDRYRDLLLDLGIHIVAGRSNALQHLQRFGSHYRQCFVSRPEPASYYLPLIRCFCAEAQLIYDTVDLHFSRFYRGSQLTSLKEGEREELLNLHYQYKAAESFLVKSADLVVVVTELEKKELSLIVPSESIVVIPNIHPLPDFSSLPSWNTRKDLLFVGGFDHAPNVDAVLYFCDQILPLIVAEIPDVVFHVVGSRMPDCLYVLKGANVNPIGFIDDLKVVYDKVRVFVAPLRYGAGLKGKVGQSMSFGVPVVGTNIAFEGFSLVNYQEGLVASDPKQFAKAVVQLYTDPVLWHGISTQAWKVIEERFSTQAVQHSVQSLLQTSSL